jgi:hypothetical protein
VSGSYITLEAVARPVGTAGAKEGDFVLKGYKQRRVWGGVNIHSNFSFLFFYNAKMN